MRVLRAATHAIALLAGFCAAVEAGEGGLPRSSLPGTADVAEVHRLVMPEIEVEKLRAEDLRREKARKEKARDEIG